VGVAVKECKESDDRSTQPNADPDSESDEQAENDNRQADRRFDEWDLQAQPRRCETSQHCRNEGRRPHPNRSATYEPAPKTNHGHRKDVVCPT
jgi:hypothetical protein